MLERLNYLSETLGSHKAAAEYLGYTERHYYNLRKSLENGAPLHRRVENYITRMAVQLMTRKHHHRKGH
ncbi:MAG: hypothetical protein LBP33_09540 [Candidatus Adiutrix sp.]|jgi:hypothetical protein|nr:hypothetical protein [Candidatus Adiutrix sp.]